VYPEFGIIHMRIAFIHPQYPSAEGTGATHSATQIVNGLADNDHEITVYCPKRPESSHKAPNIKLKYIDTNKKHPHSNTKLNMALRERIDDFEGFDIVHSYLTPLIPAIGTIGAELDTGTIITLNAYGGICPKNDLLYKNRQQCVQKSNLKCTNCICRTGFSGNDYGYLYQTASQMLSLRLINSAERHLQYIDGFRAPSAHVRSNYVQFGYDHSKISVIPHPIDDDFRVSRQKKFTEPYKLLYVGALSKHKGVEKLVPILEELNRNERDFELTIVGTGGMEETLREQAEELGVGGAVDFAGFVPNKQLPDVYACHDLFVFPAVWEEPLARVYLECLATGTPIITSKYGSISDIIGNGGVTVDGSIESFVYGIRNLVTEDRFEDLSKGAKEKSKDYQIHNIISKIESMYENLSDTPAHSQSYTEEH
jgi:glycosyltransferase involved in cell wall biosynthesis